MRSTIALDTAEAAEEAFYDAMQRGDLAAMMALWADDDDVVCVHPSGVRLAGLAAIRDGYAALFRHGGIDVRPGEARIHLAGALAAHNLVEKLVVGGPSGARIVECVATNVYAKTVTGWRIVLHHASAAGEGPPAAHEALPAVLH